MAIPLCSEENKEEQTNSKNTQSVKLTQLVMELVKLYEKVDHFKSDVTRESEGDFASRLQTKDLASFKEENGFHKTHQLKSQPTSTSCKQLSQLSSLRIRSDSNMGLDCSTYKNIGSSLRLIADLFDTNSSIHHQQRRRRRHPAGNHVNSEESTKFKFALEIVIQIALFGLQLALYKMNLVTIFLCNFCMIV